MRRGRYDKDIFIGTGGDTEKEKARRTRGKDGEASGV
jgi:hypothetical protein